MSAIGYLTVHAFTSRAQLPLEDVAICVTAGDGTAIALRLTDKSGRIAPIAIPVPDLSDSQQPQSEEIPYTTVNLYASLYGYEQIDAENIQIFADTTTSQDLVLVPLAEFPAHWELIEKFDTPPQDL